MSWLDWVLVALVLAALVWVVFFQKRKDCCGNCSQCSSSCKQKKERP